MEKTYKKISGIFRNPAVWQELAMLNPETDHQRMVHLLTAYEFSYDFEKSLELALFHTFGSPKVSALLDKTGEFKNHGQKRYDDTGTLIVRFMESGYSSEIGKRAIAQMNFIHGHYAIANEEYLFVLASFVFYPMRWIENYGWRQLTTPEKEALFLFFREVGKRMNLHYLPETITDLEAFTTAYEEKNLVFAQSNRNIADATLQVAENWFPSWLRFIVRPVILVLLPEKLRKAFGYRKPNGLWYLLIEISLWLRKLVLRLFCFEAYPKLHFHGHNRTYPKHDYQIENLKPNNL
ncbi:MAG: DUF2236 domain-containing protein [Verrucomicrobia bacterium]|nr:DUF2236 domain-containing protein [Cytophagales bacterium]